MSEDLHQSEKVGSGERLSRIWVATLAFIALAVLGMAAILIEVAYFQREDLWPLPGLFFIIAIGSGAAGAWGAWLAARGEKSTGGRLLWAAGGVLLGAGLVSIWSVGLYLFPVALLLVLAALAAGWGHWRRLVTGLPLALALAALSGLGIPMLDRLDAVGAPPLAVRGTIPAPGETGVPVDTAVQVEVGPLLHEGRALTTSMDVYYADAGLLWLRPRPEGPTSGSWGVGGEEQGTFTFRALEGFEPCRRVGVEVDVSGYRRYSFTFETVCPEAAR
jgi:hypothetical protein